MVLRDSIGSVEFGEREMTKPEEEVIKGISEKEQDSPSDRLHTLPDEVLHLILSKIIDPKTLLISSLISNRIAYILSLSHSLSLQIPIPIPYPKYPATNPNLTSSNPPNTTTTTLLSFLTFPFRFLQHITAPKPLPPPPPEPNSDDLFLRLIKLLRRFNGVRSLRIELPCSCRDSDEVEAGFSTVFKWKAKFGLRFEIFSFLSPKSVTKIEDDLEEDDDEEVEVDGDDLVEHTHYEFFGPTRHAMSLHHLMLLLIARHPNLRSVEIVESEKHGGLKLEGEELVRVRNALDSTPEALDPSSFDRFPARLKIWYVPRMELSSGFVMKKVTLVVFRGKGVGANGSGEGEVDDNGDALDGGFEGDRDGIFGEALAEILTKHRFKARCYPIEEEEDAW